MTGLIDGIDIRSGSGTLVASIGRVTGPIERAYWNAVGTEVVEQPPQRIGSVHGFGIDASGNLYYDTAGASVGEYADMWLDPTTQTFTFLSGGDR